MSDQRVEKTWETPSLEEIPVITKMPVEAMESSDDPIPLVRLVEQRPA